jgi:hypothetical protein
MPRLQYAVLLNGGLSDTESDGETVMMKPGISPARFLLVSCWQGR